MMGSKGSCWALTSCSHSGPSEQTQKRRIILNIFLGDNQESCGRSQTFPSRSAADVLFSTTWVLLMCLASCS